MRLNESVGAIAERLRSGAVTAEELLRSYLTKIEENGGAFCFSYLNAEDAMRSALASDERRREGRALGLLDGIPFAVEDRFCTEAMPTQCNSAWLEDYFPPYTASAVSALTDAGAVLIGKLRTRGFLSGELPFEGTSDVCRAVREGFVPFALAADTGGELFRTDTGGAAIVKPANGCISRFGMIASAPSLDGVAIVSESAEACANVLALYQKRSASEQPIRVTVGWDEADALCRKLARAGVEVDRLPVMLLEQAIKVYRILTAVEGASELALYDGVRFGKCAEHGKGAWERAANTRDALFSSDEKKRILLGTALLTGEHRARCNLMARNWREQIRVQLRALTDQSLLLLPQNILSSVYGALAEVSMATVGEDVIVLGACGQEAQMLRLLQLLDGEEACENA